MIDSFKQLPLDFKNKSNKIFANFVNGENNATIESLTSFVNSPESLFYLYGDTGSGKSHILQAIVTKIINDGKKAVLLMPTDISNRQNVSLIEMFDYICIDDVEEIASNSEQEEALFFWINEVKQANKKIILSSEISNKNKQWQLPDLISRIQAGRTHNLKLLNRDAAFKVFKNQAQQQGIAIDDRLKNYLKKNCSMNMRFLSSLLTQLDEVTLIEKKQVTIPLLKKILATKLVN